MKGRYHKHTLVKLVALAGLSSVISSCAALPAIEAGVAVISGVSQLSGFSDKVANFFNSSSLQGRADAAVSPKIVTEADFLKGGDSESARGDFATAAWFYAKAADSNPNSLQARIRLANAQVALKDNNAAEANYEAALILSPSDSDAAMQLGKIELGRGDASSALDHFSIAMSSRKSDAKLYNLVGIAFTMQGKYAMARQSFDAGLKLDPDYASLLNNYGMMELESGNYQAALSTFTRLVQSPSSPERYRTNRALVELAMGDVDAALLDAPNIDEAQLRLILARYQRRPVPVQIAAADNFQMDAKPFSRASETAPAALRDALIAPTLIPEKLGGAVKSYYNTLPTQPY